MAVLIDARARAAIARRRARGQDAALVLHVERLRLRPGMRVLAVDWACRFRPRDPLLLRTVGDVGVYMEHRVARYTRCHDISISAWRVGPLALPWVVADLPVALEMAAWERAHEMGTPDPYPASAGDEDGRASDEDETR